jgi:hypothetical protein
MSVNSVTGKIRRIVRKRAFEGWEMKLANCEVTPQSIWPTAKSLTKGTELESKSAIYGPLFYPIDKYNIITDRLRN